MRLTAPECSRLCVCVSAVAAGIRLGGGSGADAGTGYYDYRAVSHASSTSSSAAASTAAADMVDMKLDTDTLAAMYRGAGGGTPHSALPPTYCSPTHDAAASAMDSASTQVPLLCTSCLSPTHYIHCSSHL